MKLCQIVSMQGKAITTRCGRITSIRDSTGWQTDVTCEWCLAGRAHPNEHEDSMRSLLKGNP